MRKAHELRKLRKNSFRKYSFYYIIKQDIHIYVPYSRPNDWTVWTELFCGHSWVAWGCHRLKKNHFFNKILNMKKKIYIISYLKPCFKDFINLLEKIGLFKEIKRMYIDFVVALSYV